MTLPVSEASAGDPAPPVPAPAHAAAPLLVVHPSDPRLRRCAFAVLRGRGIHEMSDGRQVDEFFVRSLDVSLGRRSRNGEADVVITGDNRNISRQHARIRFNFGQGCWELVVLSKNGVLLNGVNLKPPEGEGNDDDEGEEGAGAKDKKRSQATSATAIARLASGDAISVGDREFLFLLPSKRAAVLTMEGVLEPGWLSGGVVASGKATATAIPAAAAAAAPAAAAAAALPVAV